jgi:hypothetical protein
MAEGKWVNIPGKGRRWQQPSGELMMEKPGLGFVQAQLAPVTNFLGGMFKSSGLPAYQMSGPGLQQVRQKNSNEFSDPAGREKIKKAWSTLQSPDFGYIAGELPSYQDAQGNLYDAVSGRLMWRTGSKGSSSASASNLGSRNPSERAYQAEKSRVAQLTAQDPELQRYEAAQNLAVAPGATPEQVKSAENVGMQIWAQKYGKTLAPKVKPGQAGYDVIQRTLYPGGTSAPALPAESEAMLNAIAPVNEFGVRPNVTPMPGQLPSFGSATEAMFNEVTGGGSLVTPMPQTAQTPQTQAQDLAEAYKQAMLARVLSNK